MNVMPQIPNYMNLTDWTTVIAQRLLARDPTRNLQTTQQNTRFLVELLMRKMVLAKSYLRTVCEAGRSFKGTPLGDKLFALLTKGSEYIRVESGWWMIKRSTAFEFYNFALTSHLNGRSLTFHTLTHPNAFGYASISLFQPELGISVEQRQLVSVRIVGANKILKPDIPGYVAVSVRDIFNLETIVPTAPISSCSSPPDSILISILEVASSSTTIKEDSTQPASSMGTGSSTTLTLSEKRVRFSPNPPEIFAIPRRSLSLRFKRPRTRSRFRYTHEEETEEDEEDVGVFLGIEKAIESTTITQIPTKSCITTKKSRIN